MKLRTMFRLTGTPLLLLALIGLIATTPLRTAQAAPPQTYEEVLKSVVEASASIKTWSADVEMRMKMGGVEIHSNGEMFGSGNRVVSDLAMEIMGQLIEVKSVLGDDGIQWTETKSMGNTQIIKLDMNVLDEPNDGSSPTPGGSGQSKTQDPSKMFEELGKIYDMTLMGNEVVDGVDAYVFEGTIKEEAKNKLDPSGNMETMGMAPSKIRVVLGAKDGFIRQLNQINSEGVSYMSMTYSAIQVNPPIDDSVFRYTPPEGANVIDGSKMLTQGLGGH